jgi:hypothetical protein
MTCTSSEHSAEVVGIENQQRARTSVKPHVHQTAPLIHETKARRSMEYIGRRDCVPRPPYKENRMTNLQITKTRDLLKKLCDRLFDARTPERVRRDLSMTVSVLRARLGGLDIEKLSAASVEEGECK